MKQDSIEGWDSLHPRQRRLYEILVERSADESLTLEEMREELKTKFLNTVVHHLRQLERKGYVRKNGVTGRIETLVRPMRDVVYLPLYGMAGCGPGFIAEDNVVEHIPFPARQLRVSPDTFLVKARGDSMEPMIHDGDLVLVEPGHVISNGRVALVLHQDEAKLKQFFVDDLKIFLQSLNTI